MVEDPKNRVAVTIFGQRYVLRGASSPDRIQEAAEFVDRRMREILGRHPRIGSARAAVLVAVNLALRLLEDAGE